MRPYNEEGPGMRCPVDGTELKMTDRQGVEVDYCPRCRGVWLDRGELDKIIERAATTLPTAGRAEGYTGREEYERREDYDDDYRRYGERGRYEPEHRRRRRSFLDDIFDFD